MLLVWWDGRLNVPSSFSRNRPVNLDVVGHARHYGNYVRHVAVEDTKPYESVY